MPRPAEEPRSHQSFTPSGSVEAPGDWTGSAHTDSKQIEGENNNDAQEPTVKPSRRPDLSDDRKLGRTGKQQPPTSELQEMAGSPEDCTNQSDARGAGGDGHDSGGGFGDGSQRIVPTEPDTRYGATVRGQPLHPLSFQQLQKLRGKPEGATLRCLSCDRWFTVSPWAYHDNSCGVCGILLVPWMDRNWRQRQTSQAERDAFREAVVRRVQWAISDGGLNHRWDQFLANNGARREAPENSLTADLAKFLEEVANDPQCRIGPGEDQGTTHENPLSDARAAEVWSKPPAGTHLRCAGCGSVWNINVGSPLAACSLDNWCERCQREICPQMDKHWKPCAPESRSGEGTHARAEPHSRAQPPAAQAGRRQCPHLTRLANYVRDNNKRDKTFHEWWNAWCGAVCGGTQDPARHTIQSIQDFLLHYEEHRDAGEHPNFIRYVEVSGNKKQGVAV